MCVQVITQKTYPIAGLNPKIRAIRTGEFRPPKAGEWYLSGAIVEAYQAKGDFTSPYHIARLVKAKQVITWEIID